MTFETAVKQEIEKSSNAAQKQAELRAAAQGLPADAHQTAGLHARADAQTRLEKMAADPDAFVRLVERLSRMDDTRGKLSDEEVAEAMRCVVGNSERR